MYVRESDIKDAILREVRAYVQANTTAASTYKNEMAGLTAQAKQLDGKINQIMETNKNRYEDFVMGIADKKDLQQCSNEREALQAELQDVNNRLEVLERKNQQYQLFCDVLNDKEGIGQLDADYLQNVTVSAGGRTTVELMH